MADNRQNDEIEPAPLMRRGKPVFESNPSVTGHFPAKISTKTAQGDQAYMVNGETGEVLGRGNFAFVKETEVDSEQFVKLYIDGIRQFASLSKIGALIFEFVYKEISGFKGKDKDTITLNYLLATRWKPDLSKRTFERGLAELLEKEFLFRSMAADLYFVNIRYIFNGDRLAVVRSYRRKGSVQQNELPLYPASEE